MSTVDLEKEKKYNKWIVVLSVVIPVAVAALFGINLRELGFDVEPLTMLPPIYAGINGLTALVLVIAVIAIKNKNRKLHENLMKFAIALSVMFLVMYVAYHMTSDSTIYGDLNHDGKLGGKELASIGGNRYVYYFILITHILLSVVIIPFVLVTYVRAITNNIERHKKIAKITFPLWLYVAVTGVVVYFMISPYYI
jgi:putative membrane protein